MSIVDKLKAPTRSELSRKRNIEQKKTTTAGIEKYKAGCYCSAGICQNKSIMLATALHYASICSYATVYPTIMSKICQYNSPMPRIQSGNQCEAPLVMKIVV